MRIKINHQYWTFKICSLAKTDSDGLCDPPWQPKKKIRVHNRLKPLEELEVTVHECLHAGFFVLSEQAIARAGLAVSRRIWELGYRQHDGADKSDELEQVIRDVLYGKLPDVDPDAVGTVSYDLARILSRLGYRKSGLND